MNRCTATNRRGERCGRAPAPGCAVCRAHGGAAPQVAAAGQRQKAEADAVAELRRLLPTEATPVGNPLRALLDLAGEMLAVKSAAAELVARLDSLRTADGSDVAPEVRLLERALDRCERVLSSLARLGIEERLAAVSESQGRAIGGLLRGFLDALLVELKREVDPELTAERFESLTKPLMLTALRGLADDDGRIRP